MDYPKKRTVRWIDDETGEEVGSCEYIRTDLYNELLRAADELARAVEQSDPWDEIDDALNYYKQAKEPTND